MRADPLDLLIDVLATYRLTRLATADIVSEPIRLAVLRRVGLVGASAPGDGGAPTAQQMVEDVERPPGLATLVTCRWCAGIWIAAGVGVARTVAPRTWAPVGRALALSAAAVLLAGLEDD